MAGFFGGPSPWGGGGPGLGGDGQGQFPWQRRKRRPGDRPWEQPWNNQGPGLPGGGQGQFPWQRKKRLPFGFPGMQPGGQPGFPGGGPNVLPPAPELPGGGPNVLPPAPEPGEPGGDIRTTQYTSEDAERDRRFKDKYPWWDGFQQWRTGAGSRWNLPDEPPFGDDQWNRPPPLMPPLEEEKPRGFDFWRSMQDWWGDDIDEGLFGQLRSQFEGNKRWRPSKNAEEMFSVAQLMKAMGQEEAADSLIGQIFLSGYRQPRFDVSRLFAPSFQRWGLQYNQ